ncbi:WD-40 repeat protein [Reticulomyxa filosa]|uniref:Peroxin-7 n=1 Tax=Reticulomyxa filosa TaxID=46433 RepID=X6NJ18_RETFI|nr:WD-40 repeat protein [Reticulomyxa filosa]|eukprot:ETO25739.1 WD-40 repeat protein [Reticulomyxa filosa]
MTNIYLLLLFNDYQVTTVFMLDIFHSSSKLLKEFNRHTDSVYSIDYSIFDDCQFICSGSSDHKVYVWNLENSGLIQSFKHSDWVYCVKFSPYHYRTRGCNVICSSSFDNTIRFWDIKNNQQLQIFNKHTDSVYSIKLSQFNGGRYLCSGSGDETIRLWDVKTSKSLHVFNGHTSSVWSVDFSPLQSNNKSNSIGVVGGSGYTICSGSFDTTIRIWDIETAKQVVVFKGHENALKSVLYGSNEIGNIGGANTILSGSDDKSIRLWDIRSGQQIQIFKGHTHYVYAVEYSPFTVDSCEVGGSGVICSGSLDGTIRFWDIRSNKSELHIFEGKNGEIYCLKFLKCKKKEQKRKIYCNRYCINLCYGSRDGSICIWG